MGSEQFQTLWFSGLTLGMSIFAIVKGGQIAWRRDFDSPFLTLRGRRALALGAGVAAVGVLGVVLALVEGMKLRH